MPKDLSSKKKLHPPPQQKEQPGKESKMVPRQRVEPPIYCGSGKVAGRIALMTGGDSGIGRAMAILFAREGADVAMTQVLHPNGGESTNV